MERVLCRVCGDDALEIQLCDVHLNEYYDWKRGEYDETSTNRVNEFVDFCLEFSPASFGY